MSHRLSFLAGRLCAVMLSSATSASRSISDGSALCGSLPKYVKQETWERRYKQRQLLMAQFQALIPDFYDGNRFVLAMNCCISQRQMPPTVAEVAVWLWTAQLIPRIIRSEQVVSKIAIFIAIFLR